MREHKGTIYTVCYMFSKDADEIADLFQEVLVKLWNRFDSFKSRSDIKTWIYRVALNSCISTERKKKRRQSADLSMTVDLFETDNEDTAQATLLDRKSVV